MHRVLVLTTALGLFSGLVGAFAYDQLGSDAGAAPAAQPVREQNLDTGGRIRVHEQGTANVNVNNLPIDGQGNVKVAGLVAQSPAVGRLATVASNVTVPISTVFTSPYVATADCRRIALFTEMNGADSLVVYALVSPDGTTSFGKVRGDRTGDLQHGTWHFGSFSYAGDFPVPPWTAFEFDNISGSTLTVVNATLYCLP